MVNNVMWNSLLTYHKSNTKISTPHYTTHVTTQDDGIPVELRMLMGGGASASSGASSGTSSGTSTSASAASEIKAPETGMCCCICCGVVF